MDPAAKIQFWKDAAKADNLHKLKEHVVHSLTISRIEQETTRFGGEYLPLSVYKARGFDVDDIADKCKDTESHPVLGTCYRVNVRGVFSDTIEQMVREELNESKGKRQMSKGKGDDEGPKAKMSKGSDGEPAVSENEPSSSCSDSDSSTSSSSDKKKKKKKKKGAKDKKEKGKKNKKDKKEKPGKKDDAAKEERKRLDERKKAEKKAANANTKFASRVVAKLQPLALALKRDLGDKHLKHVPDFSKVPAKKAYNEIKKLQEQCEKVLDKRGEIALEANIETIDQQAKEATHASSLLASLLATARNHNTV
jgi:hypothetical protein